MISDDESSQSLTVKLVAIKKALQETKRLVIVEIERLRQVLVQMTSAPEQEVVEDDISQTDRTIDSTSMPEEVVSPRESEFIQKVSVSEKKQESDKVPTVQESKFTHEIPKEEFKVPEIKPTVTVDTQTGKSLMSEPPSVADKSIICQPEVITTHDVSISCAPPQEVEVQTSEPHTAEKEFLENIQIRQIISDGHETIEIASRPVVSVQQTDEQSLFVDANYRDDKRQKESQLNITHSIPQSFETVMVEPDETTTEVVVDADGTKRIIVKKVRKTLVTRQQTVQTHQQRSAILSREGQEHSVSQITLREDKGASSTALDDGVIEHIQYQTYGGEVVSGIPGAEVTIQEFTSRPDLIIQMEKGMKPEEILQLAEGELPTQVQTSSSSVTAVVQQVTKRIIRTRRRIIRRVVIIDGKEHVTEEIVEEPDNVEVFEEQIPRVSINVREHGGVQFEEIDDPSDRRDQSPGPGLPPGKSDRKILKSDDKPLKKTPKDDKLDKKDNSKDKLSKSPSDKSANEQELERLMEEYVKKESDNSSMTNMTKTKTVVRSSQERESTPVQTYATKTETFVRTSQDKENSPVRSVTISESQKVLPPEDAPQVYEYLVQEPLGNQEQELQKIMREFMQKENEHGTLSNVTNTEKMVRKSQERDGTPTHMVTLTESHDLLPSDDAPHTIKEYCVQEPQDEQTVFTTHGVQHSTFETSSSNISTIVQKVTRKITRTRRRVIKHIQIIGGKEHVTEEVIEEPDDVEIIEEEPQVTHNVQTEGVKTKRIRIIKQVQIVDGKEHITEQIVEEPDDEFIPDSTITAAVNVQITENNQPIFEKQTGDISELPTTKEKTFSTSLKEASILDITKSLIGREQDHSAVSLTLSKKPSPPILGDKTDNQQIPVTISEEIKVPADIGEIQIIRKTITEVPDTVTTNVSKKTQPVTTKSITTTKITETSDITKQPIPDNIKEQVTLEQVPETGVIHIVRKIVTEGPDVVTKTVTKEFHPVTTETVPTTKINEPSDIKKLPSQVSERVEEQTSLAGEKTVTPEKTIAKPDSGLTNVTTTTKDIKKTHFILDKPEGVKETLVTSEITPLTPKKTIMEPGVVKPEETLQQIQYIVQSTEPQISVTTITTKQEAPVTTEFVGYNPSVVTDTTITDITKAFIGSEVKALASQTQEIQDDNKKEKLKDKPKDNTGTTTNSVQEKLPETLTYTVTRISEPQPNNNVTILTPAEEIAETGDFDQNKPANLGTKITGVSPTDSPKSENDTTLVDITKSLISTEIENSIASKIPGQPVTRKKKIPKTKKLVAEQEQVKLETKTATASAGLLLDDITSIDNKKSLDKNVAPGALKKDITKSLTQSEIDDIFVSKIPFPPVKTPESVQPEKVVPLSIIDTSQLLVNNPIKTLETDISSRETVPHVQQDDRKTISTTETFIIQTDGVSTKNKKIIKTVQIIDGKEHVIEQIVEEPDEEFVPDSTVTAEINLQISKIGASADHIVGIADVSRQTTEKNISTERTKEVIVEETVNKPVKDLKKEPKEATNDKLSSAIIPESVKLLGPDSMDQLLMQTPIEENESQLTISEVTKHLLDMESIHIGHIQVPSKSIADKPADVIFEPNSTSEDKLVDIVRDKIDIKHQTVATPKEKTFNNPTLSVQDLIITTENISEPQFITSALKEMIDKSLIPEVEVLSPSKSSDTSSSTPVEIVEPLCIKVDKKDKKRKKKKKTTEELEIVPDVKLISVSKPEDPKSQKEVAIAIPIDKSQRSLTSDTDILLQTTTTITTSQPLRDLVPISKDLILHEGSSREIPVSEEKLTQCHISTEKAPVQSCVEVEPLKVGITMSETDSTVAPEATEVSYVQQFVPNIQGSSESVNKLLASFGQPEQKEIPTQTTPPVESTSSQPEAGHTGTKFDSNMLLNAERQDTNMRVFNPDPSDPDDHDKPKQTVDISMSLTKQTNVVKMSEPKVKVDLKVEGFETNEPFIVKKDIDVNLPSQVTVTREEIKVKVANVVEKDQSLPEISPAESLIDSKRSKKRKKHKRSSESSEHTPVETQPETDKSVADTDSTSLSHYVELPFSPPIESPKPSEEVLAPTPAEIQEIEQDSFLESETNTEEQGYEPEDISLVQVPTPDKTKRQRRRKQHGVSEDTTYPRFSSTESYDKSVSTPVEKGEPICIKTNKKDKKRKKKTSDEPKTAPESELSPEIEPKSPKIGSEIVVMSPKDESYRTISEASDIDTVKIVEECVQSSPETVKTEVKTTVTFTVPVVEEITVQEGSIQTSPEPVQPVQELPRPETFDTELQTSPTAVSEVTIQTTPVEDKEAHTQTIEKVEIVEKVQRSNTEMQTSRSETPEKIEQLEVTTQVGPRDISTPEEKFSQTTPPLEEPVTIKKQKPEEPEIVTEVKEIQTSPEPEVRKDEKSTEIIIETTETDIQTTQHEQVDQETSTTPVNEKEVTEMSIQTPEVTVISTFTQSEEPEPVVQEKTKPVEKLELPSLEIAKKEIITVDCTQQTSPRDEMEEAQIPKLDLTKVDIVTVDSIQQTTPREPEVVSVLETQFTGPVEEVQPQKVDIVTADYSQQTTPREPELVHVPEFELPRADVIMADSIQQTTPRKPSRGPTPVAALDLQSREVITIDSTQQTSPRVQSEDSISMSTDEPYEVHLRARITIPGTTTDFLENERQLQEASQSIVGDKQKQRKKKSKKKVESPMSPESLSDPVNSELSESVTPTSEDYSSRDPSSIDEGISHLSSSSLPKQVVTQTKLTYSDVVQRSKSKSPSPIKSFIPQKSEKARLLDALEKRTQSVTEPRNNMPNNSMTVALLEPSVEKSYDLIINKEIDVVKNGFESNDPAKTEKSVIIVIETISIWLEEIQYRIQRETVSGIKPTSEEIQRLQSLQNYVKNLKEIIEVVEVNDEIITLIETLTRQVDAVKTLSKQSPVKVKEVEKEWESFQEDIDRLTASVERVKSNLDNVIMSEAPTQIKLDKLDKIESDNSDNFETITRMFKIYRVLLDTNPKTECLPKLFSCEDDTKQVENIMNTEKDRLLQLTSLAEEYEQTLQDFGQITDVAEALLDSKIIVSDLDHLHEEIQKHRKFFVNLSHCRAILESLEDNLDSETKAKYAPLHNSLHDRATVIIDRAASRAQQMTLAASRWKLLEQGMKEEQQWLIVAQQRIPDLTNVTSRDHEQYINLYQSISHDVSHHYAKLLKLLSITKSLQNLIVCSGLENECSNALDMLLKLQEDVDSRLTRLTAFKENWVTYDHLIDRIEGWMKIANRELEFITPENITTTGNLRRFWELKAQHEVYNNLKNESGVQFERALEILPISDEMVQRQFFSKVEDKWRALANRIGDIHSSAIQNISDRDVSSSEKLNILEEEMRELRAALDGLKGVVKSEDELNLYIERLQVMTGRIDRIQNELGRLSLLPTAESERVGALLTQSGILDDQLSEEMERSLLLKEKIVQVQAGIHRCQKSQRKARLTLEECEAAERLGSDVVERASQTCERLIENLASQWRDILGLRQALHTLPTSLRVVVSPIGVERDISALQVSVTRLSIIHYTKVDI